MWEVGAARSARRPRRLALEHVEGSGDGGYGDYGDYSEYGDYGDYGKATVPADAIDARVDRSSAGRDSRAQPPSAPQGARAGPDPSKITAERL